MKISLCLITWNELQGCKIDIPNLPRGQFEEIFAIDGGSTDGTVEYLQNHGITVYKQSRPGLNAAYVDANNLATGDAVIVFFPKGTLPTEDLCKFRQFFEQGHGLVIASRQVAGATNEEDKSFLRPRKWLVMGLAITAALLWRREGHFVRDVLHGFKGWTRNAFKEMEIQNDGLSIDIEMVARSYKLRIKRTEFPTREKPRLYGDTHFKIWPTGKKLLAYLLFELLRGQSPKISGKERQLSSSSHSSSSSMR